MNNILDFLQSVVSDTSISVSTVLFKLMVSLALGVAIGIERQLRRRDAGLRTFTLICTGSTCAMLISIWIPQVYPNFLNGDPGRIAAQVLTGIGFLGAGAIVRGKGSVQGLTTAACIWQASVIGLAVGAGLYSGAIVGTVFTLFVLVTVEKVEQRLFLDGTNRMLVVKCSTAAPDFDHLRSAIVASGVVVNGFTYSIDYQKDGSVVTFKVNVKADLSQKLLCDNLRQLQYVVSIDMVA